jgi:hypothetical protein
MADGMTQPASDRLQPKLPQRGRMLGRGEVAYQRAGIRLCSYKPTAMPAATTMLQVH